MNVLVITVFVSLVLVIAGLVLFVSRVRDGDFEHGDRLSLLPLGEDDNRDEKDSKSKVHDEGDGHPARS